jgi:hypothetical protein
MSTVTIPNLPSAGALTGTEVLPIVQSNTTSKTTVQAIANLAGTFPYTGSAKISGSLKITGSVENGENNIAIGAYSHAEGYRTTALGSYSHAEGISSTAGGLVAIGTYSHTEGNNTKTGVLGTYYAESVVNGLITLTGSYGDISANFNADNNLVLDDRNYDGVYSVSLFKISQSYFNSTNTIVELYETSVNTTTALVNDLNNLGFGNGGYTMAGDFSHAEGSRVFAVGNFSHAEGFGSIALGLRSHAEGGGQTMTIGDGSHAEGGGTTAAGPGSHAEGVQTLTLGDNSHAEGYATTAIAWFSHTEGYATTVGSGYGGHAEGWQTFVGAGGGYAHAEGYQTTTLGAYSHAEGLGTVTNQQYMHATGRYNATGSTSDYAYFVVGKGTSDGARSNAFRVSGSGQCLAGGTFTNGGADYAEYFESFGGNAIPLGTVVELTGSFIKPCTVAENAIGVISNKPSVLGNSDEGTADEWTGKYKKDIWGNYEMVEEEYQEVVGFEPIEKEIQVFIKLDENNNPIYKTEIQKAGATPIYETKTKMVRALNPDYDPTIAYIPRAERPEWNVVGLVGQIKVLKNQPVSSKWIKMKSISSEVDLYFVK